jgi:CubicO group peptidase (beta-lactamase class C family)
METRLDKLADVVEPILHAARIPGVAIAVVSGGRVHAAGYGYRDLQARLPMTSRTIFPIASTSKSINATLLGMLVDEGKLSWDTPVREYLPGFCLSDPLRSTQITLRDLMTMRTGLPRHDWLWVDSVLSRSELVQRLRHLELTAGFRERYQYNNLTVTTAGYVAEVVTGRSWDALVQERILDPLGMRTTSFSLPAAGNATASYHENGRRELVPSPRLATEVTAPSGGAIHSTVEDMARWMLFNLGRGGLQHALPLQPHTLKTIHAPQVVVIGDVAGAERKPNAMYAMGWMVDHYNGCERLSHGGYLHDVDTEMMLVPAENMGVITVSNFGPPLLALPICEHVFDIMTCRRSPRSWQDALQKYEAAIADTRGRGETLVRIAGTQPSRALEEYAGSYVHAGYGEVRISREDERLTLQRHRLSFRLRHWHYDVWTFENTELFSIHRPHPFDAASLVSFHPSIEGRIDSLAIRLEPAAEPIRLLRSSLAGHMS